MESLHLIQDLAVVLCAAALAGWLCHRAGLSAIVGYLAAGALIGPHSPLLTLVADASRIETLSQLGLVFLMFSIGMRLSLRRLRALGLPLLFATAAGAVVTFNLSRVVGAALGWSGVQTLFLAGILMVSSSAIISKVLQETGASHERTGQMALGVSVLEDVVAVVMLTLLTSLVQLGGSSVPLGETVGLLGAFVVLAGVLGLLLVPWLLRRLVLPEGGELRTLTMAALLLLLGVAATRAGYSLALGAFLLGAIVADTPFRPQVERSFEGARDLFSAVFFVSMGLMIDLPLLGKAAGAILVISLLTIAGRTLATYLGLIAVGTDGRDALRVGLSVVPIGEFSFIIAQLGVSTGVWGSEFFALAVGVSLVTTLVAPVFIRRSQAIADALQPRQPRLWRDAVRIYQEWLGRLREIGRSNVLWQLSRRRFIQLGVEVLLVTGLLAFSEPLAKVVLKKLAPSPEFAGWALTAYWAVMMVILAAPLLSIWRNLSAMSLLYAQATVAGYGRESVWRPLVEAGLKTAGGIAIAAWLMATTPVGKVTPWMLLGLALLMIGLAGGLWRKLVYWHSNFESELHERLAAGQRRPASGIRRWLDPRRGWNLVTSECALPDWAECRGKSIGELGLRKTHGCSVVLVERQGVILPNPGPDLLLFPRDRVLLLGSPAQVAAGRAFLSRVALGSPNEGFDEVTMDSVRVGEADDLSGKTLQELGLGQRWNVQVAGIERNGEKLLNPSAEERVLPGDQLLVLGPVARVRALRTALENAGSRQGGA